MFQEALIRNHCGAVRTRGGGEKKEEELVVNRLETGLQSQIRSTGGDVEKTGKAGELTKGDDRQRATDSEDGRKGGGKRRPVGH